MIPYALKIAFLAVGIAGTVLGWIVLIAFSKSLNSWWAPMVFGASVTLVQLTFALGNIWNMDPSKMPEAFCLAQVASFTFFAVALSSICAVFSLITAFSVLRPRMIGRFDSRTPLHWRPVYIIPMLAWPGAVTLVQAVLISGSKRNIVWVTNGMHCDVLEPIWLRFIGYSGAPLVLAIPSFLATVMAIWKMSTMHRAHQSLSRQLGSRTILRHPRGSGADGTIRTARLKRKRPSMLSVSTPVTSASVEAAVSQAFSSTRFQDSLTRTKGSSPLDDAPDSPMSATFPIFSASPAAKEMMNEDVDNVTLVGSGWRGTPAHLSPKLSRAESPPYLSTPSDGFPDIESQVSHGPIEFTDPFIPKRSHSHTSSITALQPVLTVPRHTHLPPLMIPRKYSDFGPAPASAVSGVGTPYTASRSKAPAVEPTLYSGIWRLLLFEVVYIIGCILLAFTTIQVWVLDVPAPPFGTEAVVLVLIGWGSVFVFGHSPGVIRVVRQAFCRFKCR